MPHLAAFRWRKMSLSLIQNKKHPRGCQFEVAIAEGVNDYIEAVDDKIGVLLNNT